jgi:hypothetical protein
MRRLATAVAVVLVLAGCGGGGSKSGAGGVTVQLNERNGSGESGTATLTPDGDKTEVVLKLNGASAGKQPAHIHFNMCGGALGDVFYTLNDVVNGSSNTNVPHALADLQASPYAINVHKSYERIETFVACGNIPTKG